MAVLLPSYATPTIVSKRINQKFWTQTPLIKTVSRDYADIFKGNNITTVGSTIQVPLDNRYTPQRGDTVIPEGIVDRTVPVTVQQPIRTAVNYTTTAELLSIRALEEQTIDPMAVTVAAEVERDIYRAAEIYAYNFLDFTSTINNSASGFLDSRQKVAQLSQAMRNYSIPSTSPWYLTMSNDDMTALAEGIPGNGSVIGYFPQTNDKILRDDIHAIGRISSLDTYWSEIVYTHTCGTAAPSASGVSVLTTVSSGSSLTLTGITPGQTLVAGDRLIFTSSYRTNPVTRQDIRSQNFTATVLTGGIADGSGHLPITIYCGPQGVNSNLSDPYRNLNRPLTAGDTVQLLGSHKLNLAYQKRGLLFAPIAQKKFDLPADMSGVSIDKNSGLGFRVTKWPNPLQNQDQLIVDALEATGVSGELVYVACSNIG